ncbi:hypothetical protein [Sulfuriferula nivalis]|nr:hypothetical protein [Sulfuriferula nivalis]
MATALDLNRSCNCQTLNAATLYRQLSTDVAWGNVQAAVLESRPYLFSSTVVFVCPSTMDAMAKIVSAIEATIMLPSYQQQALSLAPSIAVESFGPSGVFMGYDFHLGEHGPQLIEINTNAGGALLNVVLARAQQVCCEEMAWAFKPSTALPAIEQEFLAMFQHEWALQRGDAPMGRIAIVDDDPDNQYLHPEFKLFQQMFERAGIAVVIADARELTWVADKLHYAGQVIDMVYNRLTDFYLAATEHEALRVAYEAGAVVLTPNPHAHALHADKRNLVALSDVVQLGAMGVAPSERDVLLAGIPRTQLVSADNADKLWHDRRHLFFKPATGYGSKAAYRGDKLTRRVWQEILQGDYVAQAIAPPSERLINVDGVDVALKLDVRVYTYQGAVQLVAARLYAGQTTNFRTPGGGFAPVFVVPQ